MKIVNEKGEAVYSYRGAHESKDNHGMVLWADINNRDLIIPVICSLAVCRQQEVFGNKGWDEERKMWMYSYIRTEMIDKPNV